jgi:hypothetical protein
MTFDASPFYFALGNVPNGPTLRGPFLRLPGRAAVANVRDLLGDDLRILFVVRDPVDWLNSMGVSLSHYGTHEMPKSRFRRTSAERISCFADSLETWLTIFPREQFLFLDFATLFTDLNATLALIHRFMGLPVVKVSESMMTHVNSGRRRAATIVPFRTRHAFHDEPANRACKERLEQMIGMTFDWDRQLRNESWNATRKKVSGNYGD